MMIAGIEAGIEAGAGLQVGTNGDRCLATRWKNHGGENRANGVIVVECHRHGTSSLTNATIVSLKAEMRYPTIAAQQVWCGK